MLNPGFLFPLFWSIWFASWMAASRWSSPAVARPAMATAWLYRVTTTVGAILILCSGMRWLPSPRLWSVGYTAAQVLAFLTLPGFLFTWWARLHLGRLWSSSVTRKDAHRVVDTGPYGIVRHPIYTGLIAAFLVSAIASGTVAAVIGFVSVVFGFWVKARLEERFLAAELGADAYGAYRRRVPMLVPVKI